MVREDQIRSEGSDAMSLTQETTGYRSALRIDPVVSPSSKPRTWSAEEDAILREMWANPAVTRDTIARALSRSTPSIAIRAGVKHLGKRPRPPLTIDEERRRRKRECDQNRREREKYAKETSRLVLAPSRRVKLAMAKCAWPLDRQGKKWTQAEDDAIREAWASPHPIYTSTVAALLHRSVGSVTMRANALKMGMRASIAASQSDAEPDKSTAPAFVRLLPEYDGVVMTPRLEMAWHTILTGASLKAVMAATPGLTSVEIAALRRWSAKA